MDLSWLHISDFHFKGGDPYDRDVVLRALVRSVQRYRDDGRKPDLIFATGDVAYSGKAGEYEVATAFFDALLAAAGTDRRHLFIVPGNHDVDRPQGAGLARTLASSDEADAYFEPSIYKGHISRKQAAFVKWYNRYFDGIRAFPETSTCGPVEPVDARGHKVGILPLNSALFCLDDDHAKLWIGRRCLDAAVAELKVLGAALNVALLHHPLDWLHDEERSNIRTMLRANADLILHGHLHETDVEHVVGVTGAALHMAAGATYQTRRWPNRALYGVIEGKRVSVFPIRYEDRPHEVWTIDPSVFPDEPTHTRSFAIPRLAAATPPAATPAPEPPPPRWGRSNIPSRRSLPFVGREDLIDRIRAELGEPSRDAVVVLHGQPGVGKSELAREFARRNRERYPGGTFFLDAGRQTLVVDLARIGRTSLDLETPPGLSLEDQGWRTLAALGTAPSLLIYDNVPDEDTVLPWLPPAGMPCHVLMTTVADRWDRGWQTLPVTPLPPDVSVDLIERIAGHEVATRFGARLAALAGGLPVQIVPASATLAHEARRGRLDAASLTLTEEAQESFLGVYRQLDPPARLLLYAAARLNAQCIPSDELQGHVTEAAGWSAGEFRRHLDACLDLHLLEGGVELRMHQLFARFVSDQPIPDDIAASFGAVVRVQAQRLVEVARELYKNLARADLAARLMAFSPDVERWSAGDAAISIPDGETIGQALYGIGAFAAGQPWFERAIVAKERGDVHGGVDHDSLGRSLYQMGYCLSSQGQFAAAQPWYERAVVAEEQGNVDGRVDHISLGSSLHQAGYCLLSQGQGTAAQPWFERAVVAKEQGDVDGRVDHNSLSASLYQMGYCLLSQGRVAAAQPWFERAVAEAEQGDVHGRIDHESLGVSLNLVGYCLLSQGLVAAAQPWYERAVAAQERGDVHSRVDYASLGRSLNQVGHCLSSQGQIAAALPWFERAVAAKEQGDIHGRVDHDSLGKSLYRVGYCLSSLGQFAEAQPWYERAITEAEQGDIHGHVDNVNLRSLLRSGAEFLRKSGQAEMADAWDARATALEE